jgi:hypothetical protein
VGDLSVNQRNNYNLANTDVQFSTPILPDHAKLSVECRFSYAKFRLAERRRNSTDSGDSE